MNAREFLNTKGIYSLDTKKRTDEVLKWMEEYATLSKAETRVPTRAVLIELIDRAVDENQTLGADNIADCILEWISGGENINTKK